jgi:6-pyruvoyltetrahydropterin/6-carboxytetrahydropterin synthase
MFELSKQFRFESAHTLQRPSDSAAVRDASRRIHGHSYRAEVVVRGNADAKTGMVVDFGMLEHAIAQARRDLDHHFLDDVADLGPPTMENLSSWIWRRVSDHCAGMARVTVYRDSTGETCSYFGPDGNR